MEFRSGAGLLGAHPFPAGLDDCAKALSWMHEHRAALGVSSITVAGESGGGNLSLATALRAKRDGQRDHATNPCAGPYYAGADDLAGLPPHVISVCELDPLRDEGAAYYRALVQAGVAARGRTVLGVGHAGDLMFRRDIPENY